MSVLGFIIGFLTFYLLETVAFRIQRMKQRFWDNPPLIHGYHVHHSFYGLVISFIGIFGFPILFGFGLGMIAAHTLIDKRLVFIEKQKC
jgi:hypothetical protein